jgi:hypothetical protein
MMPVDLGRFCRIFLLGSKLWNSIQCNYHENLVSELFFNFTKHPIQVLIEFG